MTRPVSFFVPFAQNKNVKLCTYFLLLLFVRVVEKMFYLSMEYQKKSKTVALFRATLFNRITDCMVSFMHKCMKIRAMLSRFFLLCISLFFILYSSKGMYAACIRAFVLNCCGVM